MRLGEYDYESIYALDLDLINEQFNALFRGEEVELPKYDFQSGKSKKSGNKLKMNDNNVLVVEGIHALNPELTAHIPQEQIFRVYASALTTILLDNHNYIPTTDNRLLRRIIRDYKYRGVSCPGDHSSLAFGTVLARTSGYSLSRRMPMRCSIQRCSTSWL